MALLDKERSLRVGERDTLGFEFYGDDLPSGVTVSSGTVAVSPATGLTLGSATAVVTAAADGVYAWATGVTAGEYYVTFTVTFSDGKILPRVFRVIIPDPTLRSNALVSVNDFKNYYGESITWESEGLVESIIHSVSQEFDRFCGRVLKQTAHSNLYLDGNGEEILYLPSWPAASVTGVYEDDTLLVEGLDYDYVVYTSDDDAYLRKVNVTWPELTVSTAVWLEGPKTIKITSVTLGYATIPGDIQLACLKQCALEYQRAKQKTWGETSRSSESQSVSHIDPGLLPDVEAVLKRYRRVRI